MDYVLSLKDNNCLVKDEYYLLEDGFLFIKVPSTQCQTHNNNETGMSCSQFLLIPVSFVKCNDPESSPPSTTLLWMKGTILLIMEVRSAHSGYVLSWGQIIRTRCIRSSALCFQIGPPKGRRFHPHPVPQRTHRGLRTLTARLCSGSWWRHCLDTLSSLWLSSWLPAASSLSPLPDLFLHSSWAAGPLADPLPFILYRLSLRGLVRPPHSISPHSGDTKVSSSKSTAPQDTRPSKP